QVYAQNEMLAYQQKESTARVASIMENTNLSKQQQVSRSEERFSRNAEAEIVCRLLLEKKKEGSGAVKPPAPSFLPHCSGPSLHSVCLPVARRRWRSRLLFLRRLC